MTIIATLLLIGLIYLIIQSQKLHKQYTKQRTTTAEYLRIIFLLMQTNKNDGNDLKKELIRSYLFDANALPGDEFDKKWEAISEACSVPIIKDHFGITLDGINRIVTMLNTNEELFQQIDKVYPHTLSLKQLEEKDFRNIPISV